MTTVDSKARRSRTVVLGFAIAPISLAGCERDVEPDNMHKMKTWMTAVCKCTTKDCAAKLKEPKAVDQADESGKPQYKLESYKLYESLKFAGEACKAKLK